MIFFRMYQTGDVLTVKVQFFKVTVIVITEFVCNIIWDHLYLEMWCYGWIFPNVCNFWIISKNQTSEDDMFHQWIEEEKAEAENGQQNGAKSKTWKRKKIFKSSFKRQIFWNCNKKLYVRKISWRHLYCRHHIRNMVTWFKLRPILQNFFFVRPHPHERKKNLNV